LAVELAKNAPGPFLAFPPSTFDEVSTMTMTLSIGPVMALIAGILILLMPRLLNFIVAIYLILVGLLGLFGGHIHGVHV
jgi:hypothetical protein